jgi:hypothetical protein
MKKIQVTIREKDKKGKNLSILNLRDEVVNFLYKDTVANATKADMQFFVLLFFSLIKIENKTLLEKILDDGIPKFKKLNSAFSSKKGYLKSGEYGQILKDHGMDILLKNDIFFVLVEAVLNIKEIEIQFGTFLENKQEIKGLISRITSHYLVELSSNLEDFKGSRIKDDRYDENGNYHDLSKSVYRTIRMRSSRNLDLNLQKYTTIKSITSESPVILTFLQNIDPQIIFDLWDKYHLAEYTRTILGETWNLAHNHISFDVNLGTLIEGWLIYQLTSNNSRPEKNKARSNFEKAKVQHSASMDELTLKLVGSVLKADEKLEKEIEIKRTQFRELSNQHIALQDKERIKKLEERIAQLENLSIKSDLIEDR